MDKLERLRRPERAPSLMSQTVAQQLRTLLPAMQTWILESDHSVLVCEYTPTPLPTHDLGETAGEDEVRYRNFLTALEFLERDEKSGNQQYQIEQITAQGLTDIKDCHRITDTRGNVLYLVPLSEHEKITGKKLHLKNEGITHAIKNWKTTVAHVSHTQMHSITVLQGRAHEIAPVASGIKPASFGTLDQVGRDFAQFLERTLKDSCGVIYPSRLEGLKNGIKQKIAARLGGLKATAPLYAFYNRAAVKEVVGKYPEEFKAVGVNAQMDPQEIIRKVFETSSSPHATFDATIALQLMSGYDSHSAHRATHPQSDVEPGYSRPHPKGYKGTHVNELPFNIWGFDYPIEDEGNNEDFQRLTAEYSALQAHIEALLKTGASPYDVVRTLPQWKSIEKGREATAQAAYKASKLDEKKI